jgi:hypothetical protein
MDSVREMSPQTCKTAGWIAIISGILLWILNIFTFLNQSVAVFFSFKYELLSIVQVILIIYALWRFRGLLNGNFQFHNADGLINGLIFLYAAMIVLQLAGYFFFRYLMPDAADWAQLFQQIGANIQLSAGTCSLISSLFSILIVIAVLVAIAANIVWIVFALRILRLQDDLRGMLRPFAVTTIVARSLCLTIILLPIGELALSICFIMLGMTFLRMASPPAQVDFV